MTLTKEAITRSVLDRLDLSKAASAKAVAATFEIIKKTLEAGEDVLITVFGKFCVKDKGNRRGRNLQDRRGSDAGRETDCDLQVFDGGEGELNGGEG
jgi:nucleoid DNA-binding protein